MSSRLREPATSGGCEPCGPARRNRYFSGKRLRVSDYELEQTYHIERRRVVNRAMLGWGVVQGFAIKHNKGGVEVGTGFAFDREGRELIACETARLRHTDDLVWMVESKDTCSRWRIGEPPRAKPEQPADGAQTKGDKEQKSQATDAGPAQDQKQQKDQPAQDDPDRKDPKEEPAADANCVAEPPPVPLYLLSAHYAERRVDGVLIDDGCAQRCESANLCETVVYSLRPIECCEAGLPDCRCPRCAGDDARSCEGREKKETKPDDADARERCFSLDRGNHRQLVLWSLDAQRAARPCGPDRLSRHGCLALDPDAGVPLACVEIGFDCDGPFIDKVIDAALPRRLARRNEDLFDLIRGCNLTRIKDVGWSKWLAPPARAKFEHFSAIFFAEPGSDLGNEDPDDSPIGTALWVEFTGPVKAETLTPEAVSVSLIRHEDDENVYVVKRLWIPKLSIAPHQPGDPVGTTRKFAIMAELGFRNGELKRGTKSGFSRSNIVEIEIRTDFIRDCNDQQIAGGGRTVPSSGSVPGGRFLSSFTVIPDEKFDAEQAKAAGATTQEAST